MAFSATTEWDVRTTGNAANGGGFDTAASGTDYSKQDSPQFTYTDLVIDGTTNTKCTSAAHPFDSNSPGNIINVTGGTGFTVQRVQIVSVAGSTATCDKSLGTLSSTGGTGNLGGGLLTIGAANGLVVAGNKVHVKSGTYTLTASLTISVVYQLIGFGTTHNDSGTKPLITTSTNSVNLISISNGVSLINLSLSNTAGTRGAGISVSGTTNPGFNVINCVLDGFSVGIDGDNSSFGAAGANVQGTEIKNCTSHGILLFFGSLIQGCYIHGNTGDGVQCNNQGVTAIDRCIITANGARGISPNSTSTTFVISNCTIANNTSDGIGNANASSSLIIYNNIIYGNGGWGINVAIGNTSSSRLFVQINNAFGSNTSGNRQTSGNVPLFNAFGDITITAGPFTNSGSGDFSLNATAGGGPVCKLAGYPGIFPGGLSTGYLDVGAVQTSGGGGGSTGMLFIPNLDGV